MSSQRTPMRTLRFTTFGPGEREALLRKLAGSSGVPESEPLVGSTMAGPLKRGRLLKKHTLDVCFPDQTGGTCRYERSGPSIHQFSYTYHDGAVLPSVWWFQPLANDVPAIESKGKELSDVAFRRACEEERDKYFCRASFPNDGSRKRPEGSLKGHRMTAARAKELAGRYALCVRCGKGLIAISASCQTLAEANALWSEKQDSQNPQDSQGQDTRYVVACFNRLYRCWEIPKYNPLYATFAPQIEEKKKGELPWSSWN